VRRILSIDGGGIKGAFACSFLAELEEHAEGSIGEYFDLIVGTSTGGIIALGLGLGHPARDLLGFYQDAGPRIFGGSRIVRAVRRLGYAKYSPQPLRRELEQRFGNALLGDSKVRLVIPAQEEDGRVHVFKTPHHPDYQLDRRKLAVDVALATSAAPTYFPTHRLAAGLPIVDGGTWANNPVGVACVEAIGVLGWPRNEIEILSLGCTSSPLKRGFLRRMGLAGLVGWARAVVDQIAAGQSSGALGTAKLLVGEPHVYRVDPPAAPGRYDLDNARRLPDLVALGYAEARHALPKLAKVFLQERVEPFSPCPEPQVPRERRRAPTG
jgi:hypothetical protein